MSKVKPDYTEAQSLRDKGLTILEIAELTGLNRYGIGRNTTKTKPIKMRVQREKKPKPIEMPKLKPKKVKAPKESNVDKLYKGVAKVKAGDKIFETRKGQDAGKRKVQINRNTWIFTDKPQEQAIKEFNERYGI